MRKIEVREIAEKNGFINAEKPDSQDICFVTNGKYADFLEYHTGKSYPTGDFLSADGVVLGKHKGIIRYTVGQHKGLGLSTDEPLYVKQISASDNNVILCKESELYSRNVVVRDFNLISGEAPKSEIRCKAKVRYRQKEQWATVTLIGETSVKIVFDEPQRATTPGQAAVLYDGDIVLGGGTIYE
jgi:tRNA-specific 2-thiouridylase